MITEAQSRLTDLNIPRYYSLYYDAILGGCTTAS